MIEEFEYGEEVMVRDRDNQKWEKRCYLMTAPAGRLRYLTVHPEMMTDKRVEECAFIYPYAQIRKIQKDETKSPETSPTRKEESQLRDDANWAIEQALTIGHREYGEVVRAAKLIIESQKELIKFIGQINQL